ncbi:Asp-tRNA(Asn)/Glu-tRNA(Gln) amidotransferase subunit GatA [Candidatus Peregrinibacteria bacterium]|jgi:aspartyl-tRNA(Asn)/glutamyl-tRNA(Gln) amidotransferase subunit A|nr:Asp-tRNA(Asn)/Glu-tRNA(Gln) amidotransferase subunit GatA [Candidatus Peregrinibacteria bacterium]
MPSFTIKQAHEKLKNKEISAVELTQMYLNKIKENDSNIDAYLNTFEESALKKAKEIDEKGDFSNPLTGIPYANKPIIAIKGEECNAASKILKGFKPVENATVTDKLIHSGAIALGNANMDEFAQGSSTENSAYKKTKNPHDTSRVPGGSSGGSAAAVSSGECIFSLGTDTGGSIRQPAAFCGCVGLKVSYGRVSRSGVMAYASSFDSIGHFTKNVEDSALVLESIAGNDPKDFTTPKVEVPKYSEQLESNLKGKKIAYIKEFMEHESLDPKIKENTESVLRKLEQEGAIIEEISMKELNYAIPTYYILAKAEGSTNLHRYDGIRFGHAAKDAHNINEVFSKSREEGFGDEVKRCIMLGTYTLSAGYYDAYYLKAARVRRIIKEAFDKVFEKFDAIIAPVSPFLPFKIGEKASDPLAMYAADMYTVAANLAGIPSLSIPTGTIDGLPTAVQIMGKQFNELGILQIGKKLEALL